MTRSALLHRLRNIGIIAHVDAGKTTLTERILYVTGAIRAPGEVHHGNTVTDFDVHERKHGITIQAAAVACEWHAHRVQLIDTPGHVDFTLEVERSLRVLDGAIVVLDAVAGVEPQTETVWRQADRHGVPRICFVNKLDRAGADLERSLDALRDRFEVEPVLVTWPIGREAELCSVIGLVRPPAELPDEALPRRRALLELCAALDTEAADELARTAEIDPDRIVRVLREATLAGLVVPTVCGSAYKNHGIELLLDAVVDYLPSPEDRFEDSSPSGPLSALCFKVVHDDFGKLGFVRVYSGVLARGQSVQSSRTGRSARVGRLLRVFADRHEEVPAIAAGEIGAVVGMDLATGDTLCDPARPTALEPIRVPEPVVRLAIEPKHERDRDRLGLALARLTSADPSLRMESDPETGQTLIAGLGELHVAIALERLEEQRLEVRAGRPLVAYREALTKAVVHEHKLAKQTGGPGQYAHVILRIGPAPAGSGLGFADELRGSDVPRQFVPAVREGIVQAMRTGPLGGHAIHDVSAALLGGSAHSHDSNEHAFRTTAERAFREAAPRASPVLLEPVMRVVVSVPGEHLGDVLGDLSARRGQITGTVERRAVVDLTALVPLAELFGYAGALRSRSRGRGTFVMALHDYQRVPERLLGRALAVSA